MSDPIHPKASQTFRTPSPEYTSTRVQTCACKNTKITVRTSTQRSALRSIRPMRAVGAARQVHHITVFVNRHPEPNRYPQTTECVHQSGTDIRAGVTVFSQKPGSRRCMSASLSSAQSMGIHTQLGVTVFSPKHGGWKGMSERKEMCADQVKGSGWREKTGEWWR